MSKSLSSSTFPDFHAPFLLRDCSLGFRVQGSRFGVWGLGFGEWGLGFGVKGLGFRVKGLG